jgi:4-hydroxy-3-polyprenylbenzoate decarboxylase
LALFRSFTFMVSVIRIKLCRISLCRAFLHRIFLIVLKQFDAKSSISPIHRIGDNQSVTAEANSPTVNITLAVTGASGSIYAAEMLRALEADPRVARIHFIVSDSALRVFAEELQLSGRNDLPEKLLGIPSTKLQQHPCNDIGASIASGSYPSSGMVILPCSMGTLAAISTGLASNLIHRAADVCLKERRPLLLCVRETPFNRIHLRNMTFAAEAGATIFPIIPTLYNHPQSTTEMAHQYVNRVLAHLNLPQPGAYQWHAD